MKTKNPHLPFLNNGLEGGDSANSLEPDESEQESNLHLELLRWW